MNYEPGFPKTMVHPSYQPAVLSVDRAATADTPGYFAPPGKPDRYPPVVVHNSEDEEAQRARGYRLPGESQQTMAHIAEYPKMLRHPDYKPAVPASQQATLGEGGRVTWVPVPAIPEPFPDALVNNLREEREWIAKGWLPGGRWDEAAYERAISMPDTDYEPEEWPKWIDGVLVQDPDAMTPAQLAKAKAEYPKYVGDVVVQNADEEAAVRRGDRPYVSSRKPAVVLGSDPLTQRRDAPGTFHEGPTLDVAALKKDILAELLPQLRDVIREALVSNGENRHKRGMTEEQRRAIGERLAAGRERKRQERENAEGQ